MSSQILSNENVTNPDANYIDFNSDDHDSHNLEASNESIGDSSDEISLDNQTIDPVIITIQIIQNSETAIISIGIKNAPPIIRTISKAELASHPVINDCIVELEKFLPEMLATCKLKENQSVHHTHQQSPPSVQKRELPLTRVKSQIVPFTRLNSRSKLESQNPRRHYQPLVQLAMNRFIGYHLATNNYLPPYSQKLQEYWLAGNGVFVRSHRRELEICLQIAQTQVAGLQPIEPYFHLTSPQQPASLFWLDCGNSSNSGQVVIGTHSNFDILEACDNPDKPKFWFHLPSPALIHPELLVPLPEELTSNNLSCAEIQARNYQSLFINRMTSAIAAQYLLELTLTGGLKKFASYFDLKAMSTRSLYTSIDNLKKYHLR